MFEVLEQIAAAYSRADHTRLWWRGHAHAAWRLQPSIYHRGLAAEEHSIFVRFMQMAPAIEPTLSGEMDPARWLYVMQHHGLPTRLLDWTESPLVALHFCVSDSEWSGVDGALWSMEPSKLNLAEFGQDTLLGPGTAEVKPILAGAIRPNSTGEPERRIAAMLVNRSDLRHMAQHAQCTAHGRGDPIEDCGCELLTRIDIPADKKPAIRAWLEMLQVNRQTLFPDLDNLARYVMENAQGVHLVWPPT